MSTPSQNRTTSTTRTKPTLRKLPFTQGIEIENFITNGRGDILEDGKELVAVWDQMFNGALRFLKSLTSSSSKVPSYIRNKIRGVTRKDVERHGKIIRYVQIKYQVNGKSIDINIFGPDPNISQITWLLELVTPPCEYLEELQWWINTLYQAATQSITRGYHVQPMGFNPFQSEYRAGVTCGEHHHLGGFKNQNEKKAAYNMIRAYIPHLIAISNTSPFVDGKPNGRLILKKGSDGRTMILSPDCVRSYRLKENSGQLGPNIPEYLPHVGNSFTRAQFSRYVRKEIPDDRYVDAFPFTDYDTIECRFFDAQFDQGIRTSIILLLQALALKAVKMVRSGKTIPEIKGNTIFEHRKRAVSFGLFAKFQGDPGIESTGGLFAKYYNHNPEDGGPPGKIFESLRSLIIWLKPEMRELNVVERDILPILIMLWGTARVAPPISAATFMFYLYEQNHNSMTNTIKNLSLINGKPRNSFVEILGRPEKTMADLYDTKAAAPVRTKDTTRTAIARKLQQDSRVRRKKVMTKERERLKAKQVQQAKIERERKKREIVTEKKRLERLKLLERAKKPQPKVPQRTSSSNLRSPAYSRSRTTARKPPAKKSRKRPSQKVTARKPPKTSILRAPPKRSVSTKRTTTRKPPTKKPTSRKPPVKKSQTRRAPTKKPRKKVITKAAIQKRSTSLTSRTRKPAQAYASTVSRNSASTQRRTVSHPAYKKTPTRSKSTTKKTTKKTISSTKRTTATTTVLLDEDFKNNKIIRSASIYNLPSRVDYTTFIPIIKMAWKRSIIQSMTSYTVRVEVDFKPIDKRKHNNTTSLQKTIKIERAALFSTCNLPVPINVKNFTGDFQVKFVIRDPKTRNIIATLHREITIVKPPRGNTININKIAIPPNKLGDANVDFKFTIPKKGSRGRVVLYGISQRGIVKLYEKKRKFRYSQNTLNIPVLIQPSMCSSHWYLFAVVSARGSTTADYVTVSPPLAKAINLSLIGNPPLKPRIMSTYLTEITPKIKFKGRCDIREIEILQIVDNKSLKVIKRYRLKTRIKKSERFVLESFEWKPPSMRKGLFGSHSKRIVAFTCRVTDSFGLVDESLIGVVETPTISVFKSSQ
ncbi:MAG: glutamate-cysteine ligase family protein [Candidatus Heimdallarchaeota archaeon]